MIDEGQISDVVLWNNNWRKMFPNGHAPDLSVTNLTDADLRGADLTGADLTRTNLRGANLRGANLTDADLRDANLTRADLTRTDLRGADLGGADLTRTNLRGANLRGANLARADLTDADLKDADLKDADLTRTDLRGADFNRCTTSETFFGRHVFIVQGPGTGRTVIFLPQERVIFAGCKTYRADTTQEVINEFEKGHQRYADETNQPNAYRLIADYFRAALADLENKDNRR